MAKTSNSISSHLEGSFTGAKALRQVSHKRHRNISVAKLTHQAGKWELCGPSTGTRAASRVIMTKRLAGWSCESASDASVSRVIGSTLGKRRLAAMTGFMPQP